MTFEGLPAHLQANYGEHRPAGEGERPFDTGAISVLASRVPLRVSNASVSAEQQSTHAGRDIMAVAGAALMQMMSARVPLPPQPPPANIEIIQRPNAARAPIAAARGQAQATGNPRPLQIEDAARSERQDAVESALASSSQGLDTASPRAQEAARAGPESQDARGRSPAANAHGDVNLTTTHTVLSLANILGDRIAESKREQPGVPSAGSPKVYKRPGKKQTASALKRPAAAKGQSQDPPKPTVLKRPAAAASSSTPSGGLSAQVRLQGGWTRFTYVRTSGFEAGHSYHEFVDRKGTRYRSKRAAVEGGMPS